MNEEKLSSDAVPKKFAEWLLFMGYPEEKVPSVEKISEMCRGQYYMVWRELMEHVQPKSEIRLKRLQVFCDDLRKCQGKHTYHERSKNTIVPPELEQWRLQSEVTQKVASSKSRVKLARTVLTQLMDKVSSELALRNQWLRRAEDTQRRALFLQQVAEELRSKKSNLEETRAIADSLCAGEEDTELQGKLDKCVSALRRQNSQPLSSTMTDPAASSSLLSNGEPELDDQLSRLALNGGSQLVSAVLLRRADLVRALAQHDSKRTHNGNDSLTTPRSVLAHTASLHCTLALEANKCKVHLRDMRKRLILALDQLSNYLTGESCELLVTICERENASARVATFRRLAGDLTARSGVFQAKGDAETGKGMALMNVHKAIEQKREEIIRVTRNICDLESASQAARDCLSNVFAHFAPSGGLNHTGHKSQSPSVASLQRFYESRDQRRRLQLSIPLDTSEGDESPMTSNPKLVDELNIYLQKFCLEKNRKLVLESGTKKWIFETLESSVHRAQAKWLNEDLSCLLLCPSEGLAASLDGLVDLVRFRSQLEELMPVSGTRIECVDINDLIQQEETINDRTKKRLHECSLNLQKTSKTLEVGKADLQIWTDNKLRKYISPSRVVHGQTYKEYECYYLENCLDV